MTKSTKRPDDGPDPGAVSPLPDPPGVRFAVRYGGDREASIAVLDALLRAAPLLPPPSPLLAAYQILRAEAARHRAETAAEGCPDDDGEATR